MQGNDRFATVVDESIKSHAREVKSTILEDGELTRKQAAEIDKKRELETRETHSKLDGQANTIQQLTEQFVGLTGKIKEMHEMMSAQKAPPEHCARDISAMKSCAGVLFVDRDESTVTSNFFEPSETPLRRSTRKQKHNPSVESLIQANKRLKIENNDKDEKLRALEQPPKNPRAVKPTSTPIAPRGMNAEEKHISSRVSARRMSKTRKSYKLH